MDSRGAPERTRQEPTSDAPPDQERRGDGDGPRGQRREGERRGRRLDLMVTALSALLLLGAIGLLVWEGIGVPSPPSFDARVERVRPENGTFHVLLTIRNRGGQSVQGLEVRASVTPPNDPEGAPLAEANVTLDWLPAYSERRITVILDADPRENVLDVGYEGYTVP